MKGSPLSTCCKWPLGAEDEVKHKWPVANGSQQIQACQHLHGQIQVPQIIGVTCPLVSRCFVTLVLRSSPGPVRWTCACEPLHCCECLGTLVSWCTFSDLSDLGQASSVDVKSQEAKGLKKEVASQQAKEGRASVQLVFNLCSTCVRLTRLKEE